MLELSSGVRNIERGRWPMTRGIRPGTRGAQARSTQMCCAQSLAAVVSFRNWSAWRCNSIWNWRWVVAAAVLFGPLGHEAARAQFAAPSDASSLFSAQLAAGEFSAALAGASQLPAGAPIGILGPAASRAGPKRRRCSASFAHHHRQHRRRSRAGRCTETIGFGPGRRQERFSGRQRSRLR